MTSPPPGRCRLSHPWRFLAAVVLYASLASPAAGVDLYLSATGGADTDTCGLTTAQPCATFDWIDWRAANESGEPHTIQLMPGLYTLDNTSVPNSGGWNRMVGDTSNPRSVVVDGLETSQNFVFWRYIDNNGSGPFRFEGMTFTGFTVSVLALHDQQLEVSDVIFDFTGQHGAIAVYNQVYWPYLKPMATFTYYSPPSIWVKNIVVMNGCFYFATGVSCRGCDTVTVIDSSFKNCTSSSPAGSAVLRFLETPLVHIENVEIEDVYSCGRGAIDLSNGGAAIEGRDGYDNVLVRNVTIRNVQPTAGDECPAGAQGVVHVTHCHACEFDALTIEASTGMIGAGMYIEGSSTNVTVKNSRFENLYARESGGALYIDASQTSTDHLFTVDIVNSTFVGNTAQSSGGAIQLEGGPQQTDVNIENCDFIDNTVTDEEGGLGGALSIQYTQWNIHMADVLMRGNTAELGGAIYFSPSENLIFSADGVSFLDNSAGVGG